MSESSRFGPIEGVHNRTLREIPKDSRFPMSSADALDVHISWRTGPDTRLVIGGEEESGDWGSRDGAAWRVPRFIVKTCSSSEQLTKRSFKSLKVKIAFRLLRSASSSSLGMEIVLGMEKALGKERALGMDMHWTW